MPIINSKSFNLRLFQQKKPVTYSDDCMMQFRKSSLDICFLSI